MKYLKIIVPILFVCSLSFGESSQPPDPSIPIQGAMRGEALFKPMNRIYDLSGRKLIDGSLEVTGVIQADRYYELVGVSTPTLPTTHHARLWLNSGTKQMCTEFDNSTITCLGSGGTSGLSLNAVDPIVYNSTTSTISLSKVSLSSGVTNILSISTQTNLSTSGQATLSGSTVGVGQTSLSTGTMNILSISTQTNIAISGALTLSGNTLGVGQVSLSTGVMNVLSISTQTNLAVSGAATLSGNTVGVGQISLSTGVMNILSLSTQTNTSVSGALTLSGNTLGVGQISLSTGVTGTLPETNLIHTYASSVTFNNSITISSVTGGGLSSCGDSTHALGFTSTGTYTCQTISASGGTQVYFQIVQSTSATQYLTTSGTFQAATNLAVTITPSSTSHRIKVTVTTVGNVTSAATDLLIATFKRGSTELSGAARGFTQNGNVDLSTVAFSFIDSPATTSATTYTVYFANFGATNNVAIGSGNSVSTVIAEEVL